jgi:diguanylate cyclase (GGDEF)-like protein/PAS domain S-box-containing protein
MTSKIDRLHQELRRRAEEIVSQGGAQTPDAARQGMDALLRELQVHQVELDMQNEELQRAQAELERSRDRYLEYYVFAPVGYVSIRENGLVKEINLTLAGLLEKDRSELADAHYRHLLDEDSRRIFGAHLQKVLRTGRRENCEIKMLRGAGPPVDVRVETVLLQDQKTGEHAYLCAILDISGRKQAERERDRSRGLFAAFMANLPAMAFIKDLEGRYIYVNEACPRLLDGSPVARLGKTDEELWPPDVARELLDNDREVLESGEPLVRREAVRLPGREKILHHLVSKFPLVQDGEPFGVGGFALDVTAQVQAEEALRKSRERYRTVAEYAYDWECWRGPGGRLLYVSPSCERVSGYSAQEFLDDPGLLVRVFHEEDQPEWRRLLESSVGFSGEDLRIVAKNGRTRWVSPVGVDVAGENGENLGLRFTLRDITDRKLMEQQLERAVLRDPLTGLANRTLCLDRLGQAMERSRRRDVLFAVIFLDLDRFKFINDSLGHVHGDSVLVEAGRRIQASVRSLDTVSRFGGDEFIVLLEGVATHRETIRAVKRIRDALRRPIRAGRREVSLSACYGVVLSPADYGRPEDLLQNAAIALNSAKERGRDHFKVFTARMLDTAVERMALEHDLERGIEAGQLYLEYQPVLRLEDGELVGFEALARWRHPRRGRLEPGRFIPIAEESGVILSLGQWVLEEACRTMAEWRAEHPSRQALKVAVNISARQFAQPGLVECVAGILKTTGLPPAALSLEVTETAIMGNAESAVDKLARLKSLGVGVAIDDFGTGYSSMSYLQRFPLDILKIDLSFVSRMDVSQESLEIVRMIINLAHTLKISVVAEGVEKGVQGMILSSMGCEFAQGFHFSRPLSRARAEAYLGAGAPKS